MRIQAFAARLRSFPLSRSGAVGLWMAVAILPLSLLAGAATDLRRVESVRSSVQDATDAAVLAAAKAYLAAGENDPDRLAKARAAAGGSLTANLGQNPDRLTDLDWDVGLPADGGELVLNTRARVPLAFGGLFGLDSMGLRASAASVVDIRLEVALVLDTTGSMNTNNRIGRLKEATVGLIDQLSAAAARSTRPDPLKIALVPYSNTVRVSASHQGEGWLDGFSSGSDYRAPDPALDRFANYGPAGWRGCVESRPKPFDVQDTPAGADLNTKFAPFFNALNAADRNEDCGLSEMMPLTKNWAGLKTTVQGLVPDGVTNIPLGLVWGWHALTPDDGPFGAGNAEPYTQADLVKAVVLMTDGENYLGDGERYTGAGLMSQARLGVDENSTQADRRKALDERLGLLCDKMKERGIVLYVVRVEEGDVDVLRSCASTVKGVVKFWNVTDAQQLPAVFNTIGQELIEVRLSR